MSLFNTTIILSEVNMNDDVKILSVSVQDQINKSTKLFKLEQNLSLAEMVIQDQSVIVDKVIPFINKVAIKNSPVTFELNNIENLYVHAFLKIDEIKSHQFDRGAKKAKNISGLKNFSLIYKLMSEFEVSKDYSFNEDSNVEVSVEMEELSNSIYSEKNVNFEMKKVEFIYLNQSVLKEESLSVLHYKKEEETMIFVSRENENKNFVFHTIENIKSKYGKNVIFIINKEIFNFYNDKIVETMKSHFEEKNSGYVILVSEDELSNNIKPILTFNQLVSFEDKINFLRGGEILFKSAKEKIKSQSLKSIEFAAFNKKYNFINEKERKLQIQIELKNGFFYGKGVYVLNNSVLREAMVCSQDLKKVYKKLKENLTNDKIDKNEIGYLFYMETKVESNLKKNVLNGDYKNNIFFNEMNTVKEISFDLNNKEDVGKFILIDVKKEKEEVNSSNEEVVSVSKKSSKKSKNKKVEETEAQKLLKSFHNKKSKHVFTCVYVKENEEKDCFLFHIISTKFSKTGNRMFEYKGVNIVPKFKLFESSSMFMNKIKGCMKHVRSSYSQEVSFVFSFKEEFRNDFEKLFNVLNEEQYARNAPLFSIKDVNSLSNEVGYCLHNGMKMAYDDDKLKLQASTEHKKGVFYVYSDASFNKFETSKKFGYGISIVNEGIVVKEFMGVNTSPYTVTADTSEFNSIFFALRKIRDLKVEGIITMDMKVEVRSDCLNAIRFYDNGLDKSKLTSKESLNNIYHLDLVKAQGLIGRKELAGLVEFKWIKGHMNTIYNERVDALAKKAYHSLENGEIEILEEVCV